MKRRATVSVMLIAMGATVWVGCSSGKPPASDGPQAVPAETAAPVTLMMLDGNGLSDSDFQVMFVDPIKKKYPHITVKKTATTNINNLIAAGETPDLITTHNGNFGPYQDLKLMYDLSELAKLYKLDVSRFDPVVVQAMAVTGPTALNAVPYALNFSALYYNKDLFDAFGVAYPKDGMTWDEAIELGKRMTRKLGDTQIRGLDPYAVTRFQRILGNTFYDTKTNKATLNTPEWKSIFELSKLIISIPGNEWTDAELKNSISPDTNFHTKRISAMYGGNNMTSKLEEPTKNGLNWDVAQYPSLPSRPNVYNDIDAHLTFITSTSKHKDEAMKVLVELVSDETQMNLVRKTARKSPLSDKKFEVAFAADLEFAKGKNHAGMFKSKMINSPVRPRYTTEASNLLKTAFYDYYKGKDVNTALREADEKLNQFLATEAAK
ncbi:extracellular solute-binding protein [Paenibacillus mesophilus]|uniref:ABC transporter substrate-binding protein n=1 Tax=Paenibacillus mesophilus TaxID=2582849 RepID=UPI00110F0EBF|nr:extracellular solute-binding protein [Paenibacillus mesophilus]TMV47640.1 extracellular solute-binding protein [Paenibacillus mesophilus]